MNVQSKFERDYISLTTFKRCFTTSRPTQMEDLADPFKDASKGRYTNVVAVAIFWNVVSTISAVFVFFVKYAEKSDEKKIMLSVTGAVGSVKILGTFMVLMAVSFLCSLGILAADVGTAQNITYILISFGYAAFVAWTAYMCTGGDSSSGQQQQVSKWRRVQISQTGVFWIGYTLVIPFVVTAGNMLNQRRDYTYVVQILLASLSVGIGSIAAEMTYSAASEQMIKEKANGDGYMFDERYVINKKRKDDIVFDVLVCILVQLAAIFCSDFPTFPYTPFSNTNKAASVSSIPIMFLIPICQMVYLLVKAPLDEKLGGKEWIPQYAALDFVSRFIFTLAVCYDIQGARTEDKLPFPAY